MRYSFCASELDLTLLPVDQSQFSSELTTVPLDLDLTIDLTRSRSHSLPSHFTFRAETIGLAIAAPTLPDFCQQTCPPSGICAG